jgi:FkbM family methyltransferase
MDHASMSEKPFGYYAPSALQSALIAVGHRMPKTWAGRRVASFLRSALKRSARQPIDAVRLGSRMRLHPSGNACEKRLTISPQYFDPTELAELEKQLTPGFVFLDVGANVGAYTLFIATRVRRGARVVAVEPHPVALERLRCNLALNGIDWVTVAPVAITDKAGELTLFINERNIGSSSLHSDHEPTIAKGSITVPARTLLSLVEQERLDHIDAMKVDVEGAEDSVLVPFLDAAPPALWPRRLIIEANRSAWKQDLPGTLARSGYVVIAETGGNIMLARGNGAT